MGGEDGGLGGDGLGGSGEDGGDLGGGGEQRVGHNALQSS